MIAMGQAFLASERLCAAFKALAIPRRFSAGENVFVRGEPASGVFFVSSGRILLSVGDAAASKDAGPGSALGLPATIARTNYMLTARAVDDAEVGFVPCEQFLNLLTTHPDLSFEVAQILGTEVQNACRAVFGQVRELESVMRLAALPVGASHALKHSIGLRRARQLLHELKEGYDGLSRASQGMIVKRLEFYAECQTMQEESAQQH